MSFDEILSRVEAYYSGKVLRYGATARGVDWNSSESQLLRFEKLLSVHGGSGPISINDYGCGYGALVDYMTSVGVEFRYCGYDLSEEMISRARDLHFGIAGCTFTSVPFALSAADYTVASGIFNVKLQTGDEEWRAYMGETIEELARLGSRGFAFNALSTYSDPDRRRPDLYYADPLFWFDRCKRRFSRFVSLLHDYPLYEFTIIVRH